MSVRHFGIYLAYGPTVDLRKEGLGRLLAAFLKAASTRDDVRFVLACPEWSKQSLSALCESEGIPSTNFDLVSTDGVPLFLRIYLAYRTRSVGERKRSRIADIKAAIRKFAMRHRERLETSAVATRSASVFLAISLYVVVLGVALLPLLAAAAVIRAAYRILRNAGGTLRQSRAVHAGIAKLANLLILPGDEGLDMRLYRLMENAEAERLLKKINELHHIEAWYSPTAFWPHFNKISAPRLTCVPDMFPMEFPVGFSGLEPTLLKTFEIVERTVRGSTHFLTYSSKVKWDTLVDHYSVSPSAVKVVPHACCDLSPWIKVRGFLDDERATKDYCQSLLRQALGRAGASSYIQGLASDSIRFWFYPSQFRPNKNLLTLLRAYEYLSRGRFLPHKLILTGDPNRFEPVADFIRERNLGSDVFCLHGLTTSELTACYKLADLALNSSLSEGGCPFTLTEALSVDTPVVMARIPVTEEVVEDPLLREMMLFNPYDWKDAASKVEWALHHRGELLSIQKELYTRLRQRTWRNVVDESVAALARVAETSARPLAVRR